MTTTIVQDGNEVSVRLDGNKDIVYAFRSLFQSHISEMYKNGWVKTQISKEIERKTTTDITLTVWAVDGFVESIRKQFITLVGW